MAHARLPFLFHVLDQQRSQMIPLRQFHSEFINAGGCPILAAARVGLSWIDQMPKGLQRRYGQHHLHFITFSCYRRLPFLRTARARDVFLKILDETRHRYQFALVGDVVMPEHVHLLIGEPKMGTPSTAIQVLKQRVSKALRGRHRRRGPASQMRLWQESPGGRADGILGRRYLKALCPILAAPVLISQARLTVDLGALSGFQCVEHKEEE